MDKAKEAEVRLIALVAAQEVSKNVDEKIERKFEAFDKKLDTKIENVHSRINTVGLDVAKITGQLSKKNSYTPSRSMSGFDWLKVISLIITVSGALLAAFAYILKTSL